LLTPAARPVASDRLLVVVASMVRSDPTATLRAIAARLEAIRKPTPRGGTQWKLGLVAHVIARQAAGDAPAETRGLTTITGQGRGPASVCSAVSCRRWRSADHC